MRCTECGKNGMKPAYWQYRDQIDDDKKVYFPNTWWIRVSVNTWREMQPHICNNCGCVRAIPTGKTAQANPKE